MIATSFTIIVFVLYELIVVVKAPYVSD